jgi:hypothetical protein
MKRKAPAYPSVLRAKESRSRGTRMYFTAGSYVGHSVGFAHAHSLESCVCENGSVSGEERGRFSVSVARRR